MKHLIVFRIERLMHGKQDDNFGYINEVLHNSLCLHGGDGTKTGISTTRMLHLSHYTASYMNLHID